MRTFKGQDFHSADWQPPGWASAVPRFSMFLCVLKYFHSCVYVFTCQLDRSQSLFNFVPQEKILTDKLARLPMNRLIGTLSEMCLGKSRMFECEMDLLCSKYFLWRADIVVLNTPHLPYYIHFKEKKNNQKDFINPSDEVSNNNFENHWQIYLQRDQLINPEQIIICQVGQQIFLAMQVGFRWYLFALIFETKKGTLIAGGRCWHWRTLMVAEWSE